MRALRKLLDQENGQGLVEYTMIMFLVAFALWVAVRDTTVASSLASNWTTIVTCISSPFTCGSGS
jgi:Flp pilus assembly pilin Flp